MYTVVFFGTIVHFLYNIVHSVTFLMHVCTKVGKAEKQCSKLFNTNTKVSDPSIFMIYIMGLIWIILFWDHPQRRESHTWVLWIIIIFVNWWEFLVYDRSWIFQLFTLNTVCLLLKHHTIKKCPFLIWYVCPCLSKWKLIFLCFVI